ncbi:canalicular multispecific organic anion transporter 2 [Sinocyclocheilus grahami]|uniref:canalicular multispecific organic anion transporter 2 n=1 Tax=Sinocyclocheilus grahami TaxID=75366 RepID=UPI0007ACBBBE|nr:PREDICTED: canalicular multispecific organic anion transporter 2-like [Sinocyclocheilus grahami]
MKHLCGNLTFWDSNLTKHTNLPDLPACFQLSVLPWTPCIFLWLASPFYILYLKRNNRGYIMMSILNRIKTVLGLILWIVCWTDLFSSFHEMSQNQSKPPIYFVTPLIVGMTMLLATFLIQYERLKGVQSSGVLFIFWTISVLCAIVPFRSKIVYQNGVEDKLRFTMFYIYFGLTLIQLILSCFNEKPPLFSSVVTDPNACPEITAGFLSKMTFWWFTSMAIKGYKSPLENKDLWSLNKQDSSELVVPNLLNEWEVEKSKAQSEPSVKEQAAFRKAGPGAEPNHMSVNPEEEEEEEEVLLSKRKEVRQPSFLRALLRAFGPYFLIGSAFKLLQDLITFVNPQLLRLLIDFTKQTNAPLWWGYSLAFLMFGTSLLQTLILHQHFQYCFVTGMRLRSGIIGAIYRKALAITNEAKRSSTVGEVVNLMSVDAQRFMDLTTFLNMLWSAPLQIILALFFLWQVQRHTFQYIYTLPLPSVVQTIIIFIQNVWQVLFLKEMALAITNEAKRSSTVGEVVNLMSVDAQRFMDLTTFLNMLWSAPLQIILALFFLWQSVTRDLFTVQHGFSYLIAYKSVYVQCHVMWLSACHVINGVCVQGINLSGGQRQRVSLARALYSEVDVYLLDDPLSAVDAHVAKHIFDNVIGPEGALKGKTRILVTHGISFLPQVDNILVMVDGRVSEMGSYQDLLKQNGAFAEFLRNYSLEDIIEVDEVTVSLVDEEEEEEFPEDALSNHTDMVDNEPVVNEARRQFMSYLLLRMLSTCFDSSRVSSQDVCVLCVLQVKFKVYWEYAKAVGPFLSLFICFLYGCQSAASIGANFWLSEWTNDAQHNRTQEQVSMRVGVYAALGISQGVLVMFSSFTLALGKIQAARKLHQTLLDNKFHTPQSFFDTTPIGRIINRFSKDIYVIDEVLPSTILMFLGTFFASLSTMIVIICSTPIFALVIGPLALIYFFVQRFYVATSRQLKRLESVSRSPIYSHFSETITGTSVIRAYGRNAAFVLMSDMKVDENQKSYYPGIVSNRWLGVRIEFIGNCIVLFAALLAVIGKDKLSPGLVGLSVSYALQVTMSLNWMVRMTSDLESNIVAVERVKEYSETQTEAPWIVTDKQPPPDWPPKGNVEFVDYSVRYREGLDLVLRNISLKVEGGEKIGIVGRTGAGKSSMTLCLFRLLEAADGEIVIDEVKISEIGLHDLRSKLTIIPQEPVLFSGTLRMNLDPFEKYSDEEVWKALELSHLKRFVSNQTSKLDLECSEGGENLSVGQRQLVCLARALLRKTRILVLDEATAAVDLETDDLIQSTIRTQFEDCTVFTIAHRLNTIMDYTRVLVLDKGQIAEFDTPTNLMAQKGIFYGMAKDAGLA